MPTIDELKALVYGRGRGTGIKIIPRHFDGDDNSQIRTLALDVMAATKLPPDDEGVAMKQSGDALTQLLNADADTIAIADALTRYVESRLQWTGRGAVE